MSNAERQSRASKLHFAALQFLETIERELEGRTQSPSAAPRTHLTPYTLSEDFLVLERICLFEEARKSDAQTRRLGFLDGLEALLGRGANSLNKRAERLQRFSAKARCAVFFYVRQFPELASQRRAALLGAGGEPQMSILGLSDTSAVGGDEQAWLERVVFALEGKTEEELHWLHGLVERWRREETAPNCPALTAFVVDELWAICAVQQWTREAESPRAAQSPQSPWTRRLLESPQTPKRRSPSAARRPSSTSRGERSTPINWRRAPTVSGVWLRKLAESLQSQLQSSAEETIRQFEAILESEEIIV